MKSLLHQTLPPIIFTGLQKANQLVRRKFGKKLRRPKAGEGQFLDVYWSPEMAQILETWGEDHAWLEIECLLVNVQGKVLDIACGTGVNIKALGRFPHLDIHGFDISEVLLAKATERGVLPEKLRKNDATKTDYGDEEFDYSYSIGSLEHFTEQGIDSFLQECARYTKKASFHMIPVARNGKDNGWIDRTQSYYNNSETWWMAHFARHFRTVHLIGSGWRDSESFGRWAICIK